MLRTALVAGLGLTSAFAPISAGPQLSAMRTAPVSMMARAAPVKKAVAKKAAPAKAPKAVKKPVAKKVVGKKAVGKKAPVKKAPPKKVTKGDFAYGLPGNINIIGGGALNFDPQGFLDGKSKLEVYRYRECEITHGRVGMLAALGFIVQEKVRSRTSSRTPNLVEPYRFGHSLLREFLSFGSSTRSSAVSAARPSTRSRSFPSRGTSRSA